MSYIVACHKLTTQRAAIDYARTVAQTTGMPVEVAVRSGLGVDRVICIVRG